MSARNSVNSTLKMKAAAFFAVMALTWSSVSYGKDILATAAKITGDSQHTVFQADLSKAVGFNVFVLKEPFRVVIDLPNVSFDLPAGVGHESKGLIKSFRYGTVEDGKSRIMLDTAGPVLIAKSSVTPAKGKRPAHLNVELVETSQEAFDTAYAKDHPEIATATSVPATSAHSVTESVRTIVIDPGHGGIDPGASSANKTREKDVVLAFGLALRDILEKSGQYKVVMTRNDDTFVSLQNRVKTARDAKADLFIAIHADTLKNPLVRGTTIYTVSDKATDAEAEELAQKENRADVIAGIDLGHQSDGVANILINLAQRESKNQAMYFSKKAAQNLGPVTVLTTKPIRSAAFVVLKAPDVPSVLVELGYLSSIQDEALLISPAWRNKIANSMASAVDAYFALGTAVTQN